MLRNPLATLSWQRHSAAEPQTEEDQMYTLYRSAGDLELSLASAVRRDPAMRLTTAQRDAFNQAVQSARSMLSSSRALREDIEEADDYTDVASAYRALHLTLVPTLHNALPDEYALR